MAKITEINAKEDFIVQMNGDYNLPFDEVEVTVEAVAGTILEDAGTVATSASTEVLGVLAADTDGESFARVMVRGNPTTLNAQALVGYTPELKELLEAKGLVVVNE